MDPELMSRGRAFIGEKMSDTCRITRIGEPGEWDEESGTREPPAVTVIYEGKCRIRPVGDAAPEARESGERRILQNTYRFSVPISAIGIKKRDRIVVTAATFDPDLVGVSGIITESPSISQGSARRLVVEVDE